MADEMILPSHTISLMVANKPGMLLRVAAIFSRRAYNIESLVVSPALDGRYSRMTITAQGNPKTLEQIIKQLTKLVDVLHAEEHNKAKSLEKELALIKIKVSDKTQTKVLQLVDHFKGHTLDFSSDSVIIQVTGNSDKLDSCVEMLKKFEVLELVRTGKILMARGDDVT